MALAAERIQLKTRSAAGVDSPAAREAIAAVTDRFHEFAGSAVSEDPLAWPGYGDQLDRAHRRSGETDAVVIGIATIGGCEAVVLAFDFRFLGGSMGEASGSRIIAALREARRRRLPIVSLVSSGGARMQEGMRSLIQMRRIAAEVACNRGAGIPHVTVLRNPCTGGVWVSLASTADVILALRGATVAFAGHRVRSDNQASEAFTAAGKLASGCVDRELDPAEVPATLAAVVDLLSRAGWPAPLPPPAPPASSERPADAWTTVTLARAPERPRAQAYLDRYFDDRFSLSGDRAGGSEAAIECGLARRAGWSAAYIAQLGRPVGAAGFRTAARVLRLAERLRLPVLTLIDTPGAANDAVAEASAVGTAMGDLLITAAELTVPVTSVVIGEGGSGGALALASEELWAAPVSYFAVIAPESAAAILRRDPREVAGIAADMALRPVDLERLGITRGTLTGE